MANPSPIHTGSNGAVKLADWKDRLRSVAGALPSPSALFPFDEQDRFASEQYRLVRTKVGQQGRSPQVLAISSPQVGDGKTVTALNLAAAQALKGGSGVLLVDADLRRSSIAERLGIPSFPGLRDVLRGRCSLQDAVVRVELAPNLFVLPAGEKGDNPAELFETLSWQQSCREIRSSFESVIVDTTPVGVVADYELVQAAVDAVILVIRPDHTNRDRFYKALRLVTPEKLLGVICNCVPESFSAKDSYHEYHYYRSEG